MNMELKIRLTFNGDLSKEEENEVAYNVMESLLHTADTAGIVPDEADAFTQEIEVEGEYSTIACRDLCKKEIETV